VKEISLNPNGQLHLLFLYRDLGKGFFLTDGSLYWYVQFVPEQIPVIHF